MDVTQQLQVIFDEVAKSSEMVVSVQRISDSTWELSCLDELLTVQAEISEDSETVVLSCNFGSFTEEPEDVYATMLQFNWNAEESGGVILGLNEFGHAVQSMEISTRNLNEIELSRSVEFFATKAVFWFLLSSQAGNDETPTPDQPMFDPTIFA